MSEPTVHVVTDLSAPKKSFFNKTNIKIAVAATAVTVVAVVLYKKNILEDKEIVDLVAAA